MQIDRLTGGHAREARLMAIVAGEPETPHVASCALCQARLAELRAWADDTAADAAAIADAVFTPERLADQQASILRRLESAGRSAKVIAFPFGSPQAQPRRAADIMRWAAAAMVVFGIGLASGRLLDPHDVDAPAQQATAPTAQPSPAVPVPVATSGDDLDEAALLDAAYERVAVDALQPIEDLTPRAREVVLNGAPRRRR